MSDILSKIPFVRLFLPFAAGIILQIQLEIKSDVFFYLFAGILVLIAAGMIFSDIFNKYNTKWIFGVSVHVLLLIAGISLSTFQQDKLNWTKDIYEEGFIVAEIIEQPQEKEKTIKALLNVKAIRNGQNIWETTDGKAIVYFEKDSLSTCLETGDRIIFEPALEDIKTANNPHEFDYKQYLFFHLISKQAYLKSTSWKKISANTNSLAATSAKIRNYLLYLYDKNGIKGDEFAIASALTLGYVDKLDAELKKSYSSSGAMHVLSVSGLHVGIIYLIFGFLFRGLERLKRGKIYKNVLILIILWMYACITGLSPCVIRATVMFSFVIVGQSFRRKINIYNSLAASAFFILLYDPFIIMDVGFQLSYLALLSIVLFQPPLYKLLYLKRKIPDKLWALFTVSVAAQIGTAPVSLYYFHQFPNYFFITNYIVIPLGTIILALGIMVLIFSMIPAISAFIAKILSYTIYLLNSSVSEIEKLPGALTEDISINAGQTILLYLVITGLTFLLLAKKPRFLFVSLLSGLFLLAWFIADNYLYTKQKEIIIYNIKGYTAINFIDGKDNILFSDLDMTENKSQLMFNIKNNWLKMGVENEKIVPLKKLNTQFMFSNIITVDNQNIFIKHNYISFYDKRILIIDENYSTPDGCPEKPLNVDYILITKNAGVKIETLKKQYHFELLIFDSTNSYWQTEKWIDECQRENIICFDVNSNGAFSVKII